MATCTVDKAITITASSGSPINELRQIFGDGFLGKRVEIACRIEGQWSTKEEAKRELETCIEKIREAFRDNF